MTPRLRRFERDPDVVRRVRMISYAAMLLALVLLLRLYYLQIIKHSYFSHLAEENRLRLRPIRAPRGVILDRNGVILADSVPAFTLVCVPVDVVDLEGELEILGELVELDIEEVRDKVGRAKKTNPYGTITVSSGLTFDQVSRIEERSDDLPGFSISHEARRNYPFGELFAHVLGYVGEASVQDLKEFREAGVEFGDFVGKMGIERVYEEVLHGKNGVRRIEVDALGREKKELDRTPPIQGKTLRLTLDSELQKEAARLMKGKRGAVVALNPKTGEVYVLYSSPSFDPNLFARGISRKKWEEISTHRGHPLQNRVTQGLYSPGSTVKPIYALFSLQEGLLTWRTEFTCTGEFTLGDSRFRCWKKGGHGVIGMEDAIVQSCDIYFYNLGLTVGIDRLGKWLREVGFDRPTGIDLYYESRGFVPGREWKKRRFGERWYDGETVVASIGQGYILVTPLELAIAYSAIASGGRVVVPRVVEKKSKEGEESWVGSLPVDSWKLDLIRKALEEVVSDPHGTGHRAAVDGIDVAGKTGTAQVVSLPEEDIPEDEIDYYKRDHAWFAGYAPAEDPEIAVVVLVEHGGSGGKVAAPVFRGIVRKFFEREGN